MQRSPSELVPTKPKFSIITPVHPGSVKWIAKTYESLVQQTNDSWEWILLMNSGLTSIPGIERDNRVFIIEGPEEFPGIGSLKKEAASFAEGEIIVELDADDLLTPDCLEELAVAFSDITIGFAYSNSASFNSEDGTPISPFSSYYGWETRPFQWDGHDLNEMVSWEPSVHMMRNIWWAPDHVRAWRRSVYEAIGGHDAAIAVGDDHDLCCRTYLALGASGMKHIDKCLYVYRVHGTNTHILMNREVQDQSDRNYLKYSRDMIVKWADGNSLIKLDLGGRFGAWSGFTTVDLLDADVVTDLNHEWPFDDNSVGVIKAHHIFEHLTDSVHAMNEAFRVLAPGGWLLLEVPSTDGRGAFQDPTHVSFWNENSIRYYTTDQYGNYIRPSWKGRFQNSRTITYDPFNDATVPVVQSDLIAVKGDYAKRQVGIAG